GGQRRLLPARARRAGGVQSDSGVHDVARRGVRPPLRVERPRARGGRQGAPALRGPAQAHRLPRRALRPALSAAPPAGNPLATAEPWDLVAAAYVAESLRHFDVYARAAIELAALPPAPRVADIAAGPGTISVQIARAGGRVSAIDLSEAMLAE